MKLETRDLKRETFESSSSIPDWPLFWVCFG